MAGTDSEREAEVAIRRTRWSREGTLDPWQRDLILDAILAAIEDGVGGHLDRLFGERGASVPPFLVDIKVRPDDPEEAE